MAFPTEPFPSCGPLQPTRLSSSSTQQASRDPKRHSCPQCNKWFPRRDRVQAHIKTHIPIEQQQTFVCDECGKKLTTSANLKYYKETHLPIDERPTFKCAKPGCEKKFTGKEALDAYKETHLLKDQQLELLKFKCDKPGCGKKLKTKKGLDTYNKNLSTSWSAVDIRMWRTRMRKEVLVYISTKNTQIDLSPRRSKGLVYVWCAKL